MNKNIINTVIKTALILIPMTTFSMSAMAHDPSLHVKKAKKADCSKMDHSKMDMQDPVAIAMMKKCLKQAEKAKKNSDHSKLKPVDEKKLKASDHHNH